MNEYEKSLQKVSIGMPVYNGAAYICEALDSLLAQSFTDFELIISDNASTDDTQTICQAYEKKDARVRYVRQKKNLGAEKNFHFVLNEASSEYFMWAAADDCWMPTFVEASVALLCENKDIQFTVTDFSVRSRLSCLFNLKKQSIFECVTKENRKDRVLLYTRLPFTSHKDNFVYALWRTQAIKNSINQIHELCGKVFIGGAVNEYILSMCRGGYIQKTLFIKKYKGLPPGHPLGHYLFLLKSIFVSKKGVDQGYDESAHISLLKAVLKKAGFDAGFINGIILLNQYHITHKQEKK
ncbi:MAG: glycosyltransferase family 2 protein [Mariprofundaceae bacterium]